MKKIIKYGLIEKQVVFIHKYYFISGTQYCTASLLTGGPSFDLEAKQIYVPENQDLMCLLYKKEKVN